MTLAAVKGQERAVDALRAALRSGSVHHAYLFAGPEGVGKELTAVGFVQALMCPEKPQEGCGACSMCLRVSKRNHPDITWLMPEAEQVKRGLAGRSDFTGTPSRELKVEQVRQLQERLSFRALEGGYKVALIAAADWMNTQAQNALLKTLEEPPPQTLMLLVASSMDRLLPTIRSRCSKVHFGPLPRELLAEELRTQRKLEPDLASLVAVMSAGSMGRALEYDVARLKKRKEVIERFEGVRADDARTVLRFAEDFGGSREDAEDSLEILSLWLRDLALTQAGGGEPANKDLTALLGEAAPKYGEGALHRGRELIGAAQRALKQNASPKLQLERTLLRMFETGRAG
jgi:DNA polymerase-3 subunit delta'